MIDIVNLSLDVIALVRWNAIRIRGRVRVSIRKTKHDSSAFHIMTFVNEQPHPNPDPDPHPEPKPKPLAL